MPRRRSIKPLVIRTVLAVLLLLGVAVPLSLRPSSETEGASWNAGLIIDDAVFTDDGTMSINEIQSFLNAKVPSCDTDGSETYSGSTTRAEYGTSQGYPPPYTCLKSYRQGGKSSAQIIYEAARAYDINPQVLIVTLQKEQGLVTDEWPWSIQYRAAMGFACPDTAPCDPDFAGFTKQVHQAARHLRNYFDNNPDWYVPFTPGRRSVRYNPSSSCGSSIVTIANRATAALYSYTPYQPNAAALAAGYGSAPPCGAYGNRNFWLYFNDWFGSTRDAEYRARVHTKSTYPRIVQGSSGGFYVYYKNTSNVTWYDALAYEDGPYGTVPTKLVTANPTFHDSPLGDHWGRDDNQLADRFNAVFESDGTTPAADRHIVEPGQIARYYVTFRVPGNFRTGEYRQWYQLIARGKRADGAWYTRYMSGSVNFVDIDVVRARYDAEVVSRPHKTIARGATVNSVVRVKNTGNTTWYDQDSHSSAPPNTPAIRVVTDRPLLHRSRFGFLWWTGRNIMSARLSAVYAANGTTLTANQHVVQPGEFGEYTVPFRVHSAEVLGKYRQWFTLITRGQVDGRWQQREFLDTNVFIDITVTP